MLEISIEKNCPIKGIPLKDLTKKFPDFKANILGALRKEKLIYLKKNDKLLDGDNVYVVVSGNLAELVESCFSSETCIHKETELSSISVKLPIENVSVPGIYYFVFQRLSWEGINIYEVISTSNEFTILVNEEQVDKAFRIIKDLKQL